MLRSSSDDIHSIVPRTDETSLRVYHTPKLVPNIIITFVFNMSKMSKCLTIINLSRTSIKASYRRIIQTMHSPKKEGKIFHMINGIAELNSNYTPITVLTRDILNKTQSQLETQ